MFFWSTACVAAFYILVRDWKSYALSRREYWRFLTAPWRLATFVIAATGMILLAPHSGDPTWDYFDACFMSVFTYATAPWSIGTIFHVARGKMKPSQGFVAICVWMFSASWSYDLYLLLRDGDYPITWFSNIFASSVLYASAGLFWNLDWFEGRGVTFAFMEKDWPYTPSNKAVSKIVPYMLPFMVLVTFLILYFFWFEAGI